MENIILFLFMALIFFISIALIAYFIENIRYKKYINSIKPGDVFVNELFVFEAPNDPFDEKYNRSNNGCYDESFFTTILDIKINRKNETWVKYCFTKHYYNYNNPKTFTAKLSDFLKHRHRLDE